MSKDSVDAKTKELRSGSARVTRASNPDTGRSGRGAEVADDRPLSQVGRYLLLKKLGEGGMGVVYSAYDPELDRKVALKLLHAEGRGDAELARARLQREAQAMARVTHPNVIAIYDVGVWESQVYLTMELVEGGTLASWMKEKPRPWREMLEKFLDAGRGLAAAHAAGLVHRDFKPANVLMSREGRVSVTDFGLALQVGDSGRDVNYLPAEAQELLPTDNRMLEMQLTQQGLVMGTPNYMSPEQFRDADLDSRSDQFSFCVALYYGLYGKRAFEPARMRAYASQKAREERDSSSQSQSQSEPTSPIRVRQTASLAPPPRTRDVVVDPEEERVIQEPPREVKVPAWVRGAVMRGLELEAGARFSSMAALLDALSQEKRLLKRRKWVAGLTTAAVGVAVVGGAAYARTQVCAGAATAMNTTWNPQVRERMEASLLATQVPFAQDVAQRLSQTLGNYASAWSAQSIASCEATRRQGAQSEDLFTRRTGCLERRRQDLHSLVEQLSQADAKLVETALDVAGKLPALSECADVEGLAEQQRLPEDPTRRAEIAKLNEGLAEVQALRITGRLKQAEGKAQPLVAPVLATGHLPLMAELRLNQGLLQVQMSRMPEASQLLSDGLYDAEAGRADQMRVQLLNQLVFAEGKQKHFDQARNWADLAQAALRRVGGNPARQADLLENRGTLERLQKHFPEALKLMEEARVLRERVLAPNAPQFGRSYYNMATVAVDMRDYDRAAELLQRALVATEAAVGPVHPDMDRRHFMLASVLREKGELGPALDHARESVRLAGILFGKQSPVLADRLDEVGMCLSRLNRHAEALDVYEQAVAIKRKTLSPDDLALSYSLDGVGQELLKLGRPREAIEPLRQAASYPDVDAEDLAESNFALAQALYKTNQVVEARATAVRAREQFQTEKLVEKVAKVDAWLDTLPITHQVVQVNYKPRSAAKSSSRKPR